MKNVKLKNYKIMKKEETFKKVYIPWCKKNRKLPVKHSLDPTEKKLGRWRSANRNWKILIKFNSQYEPRCKPKEKVFEEDYKPWVLENQKLPIATSPDPIERSLGRWRGKNRKWEILIEFDSQFNPKNRKSKEKVFKKEYILWCKENQKLPNRHSPDPIEKRLGDWRSFNRKWNKLIQFNILFSYSIEGNPKAKELLEKMMH